MGSSSSVMRPQELLEFRKLNTSLENVEIPASADSRSVTDKKGFIIFAVGIVILLPFFIYTLVQADIRQLSNGSDNCGNFCGVNNTYIEDVPCSGKDYTHRDYIYQRECYENCPENTVLTLFNQCVDKPENENPFANHRNAFGERYGERHGNRWERQADDEFLYGSRNRKSHKRADNAFRQNDVEDGFAASRAQGWKFFVSILIAIGVCILILVVIRFIPGFVVYFILAFSIIVLLGITGFFWYGYSQMSSYQSSSPVLILAGFLTIVSLILIIVILCLFKRIRLLVQLWKEAAKVFGAIPLVVFVPVLIALLEVIVFIAFIVSSVWLATARILEKINDGSYRYEPSGVFLFSFFFNFVIVCWIIRFIHGLQYMVIAGSTARWYFAKNKQYLDSPICGSLGVTLKFHIGTLLFGSLILTLFEVIRVILKAICRQPCCRCLLILCCKNVEVILKFLSENSYIETAIHGQSYFRSAKRAVKLLLKNASSVIAINCVGDFVLGMLIFITIIITTLISYSLFSDIGSAAIVPTTICFFLNIIIISIMFAPFQTIVDSLFICFCEDSVLNDGVSRPYYMSRGLMEFVENSKKAYGQQAS